MRETHPIYHLAHVLCTVVPQYMAVYYGTLFSLEVRYRVCCGKYRCPIFWAVYTSTSASIWLVLVPYLVIRDVQMGVDTSLVWPHWGASDMLGS